MQYVLLLFPMLTSAMQILNVGTCFYTGSAPRTSQLSSTCLHESGTLVQENDGKGNSRSNMRVQEIIELLLNHFENPIDVRQSFSGRIPDPEWGKVRRFLYRVTADDDRRLTLHQIRKVLEFLDDVIADFSIQRSIVLHSPRILTKNVKTRLRPTVDFLRSLYGDTLFVEAICRNPDLLLTSGTGYKGDDLDLVEVFLRVELQLSERNISKLKLSNPQFFQISMVQLLSVVNFLRNILEHQPESKSDVGYAQKATKIIGKLVQSHPIIFQLSAAENLRPRVLYLQERCCFLDKDLASLLKSSSGAILGLSVKGNLMPTIDFLSQMLSVSDLRKSLLSHPQILGLSLENLRTKCEYFEQIDKLDKSRHNSKVSLASRVLMKSPAVFSLSLHRNIIPTIQFLARIWGQHYPDETMTSSANDPTKAQNETSSILASLLSECPSILSMSLHGNIQPTVYFYVRAGYLSLDKEEKLQPLSNGKLSIIRGRYITASLFTRLLPRWHYYSQNHSGAQFVAPPLYILAGTTDEAFCSTFGFEMSHYFEFKEQAIPRLKFSSQFETWIHTGRPIDT
jgi:mTERF